MEGSIGRHPLGCGSSGDKIQQNGAGNMIKSEYGRTHKTLMGGLMEARKKHSLRTRQPYLMDPGLPLKEVRCFFECSLRLPREATSKQASKPVLLLVVLVNWKLSGDGVSGALENISRDIHSGHSVRFSQRFSPACSPCILRTEHAYMNDAAGCQPLSCAYLQQIDPWAVRTAIPGQLLSARGTRNSTSGR